MCKVFCIKYFRRRAICRKGGSLFCLGIPLEKATRFVGMADVIFGMIFFSVLYLHRNEVKFKVDEELQSTPSLNFLPDWLCFVIMVTHGIKFLLGIVLYLGAIIKSRQTCRFWFFMSIPITIFAFPTNLLHLYEMMIVNQFSKEIYNEIQATNNYNHKMAMKNHGMGKASQKIFCVTQTMIEAYVPTGENYNELEDGRYIGFGNTTLSTHPIPCSPNALELHSVQYHLPPPSPQMPHNLQPPLTPTPSPSPSSLMETDRNSITRHFFLTPIHLARSPSSASASYNIAMDSEEEYQDDDEEACNKNLTTSSGFYSLIPSRPQPLQLSPSQLPKQVSELMRRSMILPVVLVTDVNEDQGEPITT